MRIKFVLLFLLIVSMCHAQTVSNARFEQVGKTIKIYYDLSGNAGIDVFLSIDGGRTFDTIPLANVYGDVGGYVSAGIGKKVVWDVLASCERLQSENICFRVRSSKLGNHTITIGDVSFNMIFVEGGTFTMGCTSEQGGDCDNDEKPAHRVTLTDYYIGETEVTHALWKAVMDYKETIINDNVVSELSDSVIDDTYIDSTDNDSNLLDMDRFLQELSNHMQKYYDSLLDEEIIIEDELGIIDMSEKASVKKVVVSVIDEFGSVIEEGEYEEEVFDEFDSRYWNGEDYDSIPVQVSYDDCLEFIKKLNTITGLTFGLSTEAQWEYAARGGNKSRGYKYSGSNNIGDVAWYNDNSSDKRHNVKSKDPNELGIYDMSGNVWEWCCDWKNDYTSLSQSNPNGPTLGEWRVLRGGSFSDSADACRVSFRGDNHPYFKYGFRILLCP